MYRFADDPILMTAFEYWINLPNEAGIPDRRDLDPTEMPRAILPNVALLELIDEGADAEVRLAGQEFDENFGFSLKGKRTSELTEDDYRNYMLGHLRAVVEGRGAIYSESAFRWDHGGLLRTRRLMMPLSHGQAGVISMIFKAQTWPRDQMRGLPFYEAIENTTESTNSEPQLIHPSCK